MSVTVIWHEWRRGGKKGARGARCPNRVHHVHPEVIAIAIETRSPTSTLPRPPPPSPIKPADSSPARHGGVRRRRMRRRLLAVPPVGMATHHGRIHRAALPTSIRRRTYRTVLFFSFRLQSSSHLLPQFKIAFVCYAPSATHPSPLLSKLSFAPPQHIVKDLKDDPARLGVGQTGSGGGRGMAVLEGLVAAVEVRALLPIVYFGLS